MKETIQKICKYHGITTFKYVGNSTKNFCVQCSRDKTSHRRWAQKIKAIAYLGGKCFKCKEVFEDISVYDFHHKFNKDIQISELIAKNVLFENFKDELDKCELYCANCHCEHHDEEQILLHTSEKTYNSNYMSEHRKNVKEKIIELLGGKCIECTYNKSHRALHPHHLSDKEFAIGGNGAYNSLEKILKEIKKCILLCSNCHRPKHSNYSNRNMEFLKRYL